jgi:hypothetical protein
MTETDDEKSLSKVEIIAIVQHGWFGFKSALRIVEIRLIAFRGSK